VRRFFVKFLRPASRSLLRHTANWQLLGGLIVACVFLNGCATSYEVRVRALARDGAKLPTSYRLADTPDATQNPARYQAAGKILRVALAKKGLREAPAGTDAELLILFGCEVGPAITRRVTETSAVYMMVPGRTYTETVQVGTSANGSPIYQTITRQEPPTQQLAGYEDRPIDISIFRKSLRLKAVQNLPPGDNREPLAFWAVEASCDGESKDYAQVLPVLAAASMVYVGRVSDGIELIRLTDADQDVRSLKPGK
jgi:hypothetical protein